jgi:sugar O-acyltransferase (sialic acid O-acetyltransferase NeuD family)
MAENKKLLIFGTGTLGEISGYYFQADTAYQLLGYVDSNEYVKNNPQLLEKPVLSWDDACKKYSANDVEFFVAIGYRKTNSVRQARYDQIKAAGYRCASYISTRASVFTESIGENCFILENNVLQPFTVIGNNVTMWSGNHLGHHSVVEDNVFIASHAVISGKCRIGANSFLGVNCCLHDGVEIGEKSVVGAGAIVTESCEPRSVFVPQRTIPRVIKRDII